MRPMANWQRPSQKKLINKTNTLNKKRKHYGSPLLPSLIFVAMIMIFGF